MATVGANFSTTVESLASENQTKRMAAAVLRRRFLDPETEQGRPGRPYVREAVEVIAGLLREPQPDHLQKVLADGLRYARDLQQADLQYCDLRNAYLGWKGRDKYHLNLSAADLYRANLSRASLRRVIAVDTVFKKAVLEGTVLVDANVEGADFRSAKLANADSIGAAIGGARFGGAEDIPAEVSSLLDADLIGLSGVIVGAARLLQGRRAFQRSTERVGLRRLERWSEEVANVAVTVDGRKPLRRTTLSRR